MYGDPFGKSLCHAWAASPVYLLARYYAGMRPDRESPTGYRAEPRKEFFRALECRFPAADGSIMEISVNG